jgi:hypothetical protein
LTTRTIERWDDTPYRLVTLLELLNFYADAFCEFCRLSGCTETALKLGAGGPIAELPELLQRILPSLQEFADRAGMDLASIRIRELLGAIEGKQCSPRAITEMYAELTSRISDYFETRLALMIPARQQSYWNEPLAGWEAIIERFPAQDHIEEASRCLALNRSTACVYHLMAPVQMVLESISKRLGAKLNPHTDTWNGIISKIELAMKDKAKAMPKPKWKAQESFYAELISDIRHVKNAWRNDTMHFRRSYNYEEAEKVYRRVQDFMSHAATRLSGKALKRA